MDGNLAKERQTMADVLEFRPGGYRFIKAVFQYSGGVAAMPGYRIRRVRFARPLPLASGFARIEQILQTAGRPLTAFCQCELRSPAPFTEQSFRAFNESYAGTLKRWAIFDGTTNPVARSNVCPAADPPLEPSFYAFSYTEAAADIASGFVISGSAEAPEGRANYRDHIVRLNDTSAAGLREKARFVLGEMERRMGALGFTWRDTTATQVYTICDLHPFLSDEIVKRDAAHSGLTWHYCRPPVIGLDYEMDCRGLLFEQVIDV
jgi:hypothetical protein